jgi:hypothetical protein
MRRSNRPHESMFEERDGEHDYTPSRECTTASSAGFPGHQNELSRVVDLETGRGAAGIIGKMSEIACIQRTWEYLLDPAVKVPDIPRAEIDRHLTAAKNFTSWMIPMSWPLMRIISTSNKRPPPREDAVMMSEASFHALQGAFHFIRRESFLEILATFPQHASMLSWAQRRWPALAHIVWAVGSKWLLVSKLDHI